MDFASLGIKIDSSQAKAGAADLDKLTAAGGNAEKSIDELGRATTRLVGKYEPLPSKIGAVTTSLAAARKEMTAGATASPVSVFNSLESDLAKAKAQMLTVPAAMKPMELSAKQTAAALRGIPAQFTDIVTSLQGGQAPLTVFLQQGGQLKDMFGGAGNAAKAMGGYVAGLISPLTVAAGATVGLAVAAFQGSQEQKEFAKSIILTGNASGVTSGQLALMARNISGTVGTTGAAAEALAGMAGSGQIAGANLQKFSQVAVLSAKLTGTAVEDTVKQFVELGNDPVRASLKLNQSMNYLTTSTLEQIQAAIKMGRQDDAAAIAQIAYANATTDRLNQVKQNLGYLETAWNSVGSAVKGAWDLMKGVGRDNSVEERIAKLREDNAQRAAGRYGFSSEERKAATAAADIEIEKLTKVAEASKKVANAEAEKAKVQKAGNDAVVAVAVANEKALNNQQKMNKALEDYAKNIKAVKAANPNSDLLKPELIAKSEAAIRAQFADKKSGTKVEKLDEYTRISDAISKVNTLQELELQGGGKLAASERFRLDEMAKINTAYKTKKIDGKEQIKLINELTAATAKFQQVEKRDSTAKSNAAEYAAEIELKKELFDAEIAFNANRAAGLALVKDYAAAIDAENKFTQFQLGLMGQSEAAQRTEIELYKIQIGLEKELATIKKTFQYDAPGGDEARAKAETAAAAARAGVTSRSQLDATRAVAGYSEAQKSPQVKAAEENTKRIKEINEVDFLNEAARNEALEAEKQRHTTAMLEIESNAQTQSIGMAQSVGDQLYALLQKSGKEKTALGKALFLTNKAMAVAEIIINTEVAASKAGAQAGIFGIPMASIIRATGYASAGIVAGTAIAEVSGGRASGGRVEPNSMYRVNERGAEMVSTGGQDFLMMGDKGGVVTPNNKLGGGDGNITIVNNTSAKIGRVQEQRLPNGDRALIVQEAVEAMASQMSDPNSRSSRSISRNFSVQRTR